MITAVAGEPRLTWNIVNDIRQLFDFPFMVNALRAGTIVAVLAGAIGWFMVLRRQTFAGHTLALIGFPARRAPCSSASAPNSVSSPSASPARSSSACSVIVAAPGSPPSPR